jgi:hypothetical protein
MDLFFLDKTIYGLIYAPNLLSTEEEKGIFILFISEFEYQI